MRNLVLVLASAMAFVCFAPREAAAALSSSDKTLAPQGTGRGTHWAFQPIQEQSIPALPRKGWARNGIDYFVLERLQRSHLKPAPPADKRTLIRRAAYDLTGLPPKPEEIESFLEDDSTDAFVKVIDRLLATEQYGERWGRYWLDVARYADSNGLEIDTPYENAWRYRDYVVRSFYLDKPFNQFIREQIAGDLLPYKTDQQRYDQLTATGFLVLGPKALFEPNQVKLIADVADEQIDVTCKAFLGLTASCARCHDHKYDPIPTHDYYALAGIFKSTATLDFGAAENRPNPRRWVERPLAPPERAKAIEEHTAALNKIIESIRASAQAKMALPGGVSSTNLEGMVLDNTTAVLAGTWKESFYAEKFVDKNYVHDGDAEKGKKSARFIPQFDRSGRYEILLAYNAKFNRATNVPVTVEARDGSHRILVNQTLPPPVDGVFTSLGVFEFDSGTNQSVVISNQGTKGFVVVDAIRFIPMNDERMQMVNGPGQTRRMREPEMKLPSYEELEDQYLALREKSPPPVPMAMAVQEGTIRNSRINIRGDPEKEGDPVDRGFLTAVSYSPSFENKISEKSSGRLELANWMAHERNPLTARVAANRIWLHLIGRGLVETPDNFGVLGEKPSHPELLDYLASHFVTEGWSYKNLIRFIMLSSTYQMSSQFDPEAYGIDPENTLVWRMNRRRLEAEVMRDSILAVSGQLDYSVGGSLVSEPNAPLDVPAILNPQLSSNRRSIYIPVIRNNVPDLFQVFDFADPHVMSGKRYTTTAAPQALFMMNSPFVLEQSQKWAESLLESKAESTQTRVCKAYLQAFGRQPSSSELRLSLQFVNDFEKSCQQAGLENPALRTWQTFCQSLFAATEFRFLD